MIINNDNSLENNNDLKYSHPKVIIPKIFNDKRGSFSETYNKTLFNDLFPEGNFPFGWEQENESYNHILTVRGMHLQRIIPTAKLLLCTNGSALCFCIGVDKNKGETFWEILSGKNHHMLFVPGGYAFGFVSLEENTTLVYHTDKHYIEKYNISVSVMETLTKILNEMNIDNIPKEYFDNEYIYKTVLLILNALKHFPENERIKYLNISDKDLNGIKLDYVP